MGKPLKVLLVEDSADDATLLLHELRRGGFEPNHERAGSLDALREALEREDWDVVICDHALPGLDSFAALRTVKELAGNLPFIVVSSVIGEETAVEAMKAGAHDVVMKDRLARLVPAIEREIVDAQARYQRQLTEQAMREGEERLREAAKLAKLGHWIWDDTDRAPVYFSDEFARIHGLTPDECYREVTSIADDLEWIHPEDRGRYRSIVAAASAQRREFDLEYRVVRRDGSVRHLREVGKPIEEEDTSRLRSLRTIQDITEQKEAQEAQRASDKMLRTVADNLPAIIVYMDKDLRYRFVNRTCETWYARPAAKILGTTLHDIHGQNAGIYTPHIEAALGGKTVTFEDTATYPDGITRRIRATFVPHHDEHGRIPGLFSLVDDVSDLRATEDRLRQAQKMEAVGALTGGIAHDFNNLLAIILGHAEILEERLGADDSTAAVIRAATHGSELTARLLAVSREQALESREIDLNGLVTGMSDLVRRALGEAIEIDVATDDDLRPAFADPGQVENALLNLAVNARDAMPDGGKLRISTANVTFHEAGLGGDDDTERGDYVLLSVRDSGTGMTPEVMSRVFEPFFTTKRVGQVSGLGLSMVYGFAKQSGGHVAIDSKPGSGTTVRLYLPVRRGGGDGSAEEQGEMPPVPEANGETVMIVEDATDLRAATATILETLGYKVATAGNGKEALATLGGSSGIDLLLCDIILPGGMNGWKIAEEARRLRPNLKVLFMSGNTGAPGGKRPPTNGSTDLLRKPFRRRELAHRLRRALDKAAPR